MKPRTIQIPLPETASIPKLAYSVEEAAEALSLGRTKTFALIKEGRLRVIRLGKRVVVPVTELQDFLRRETNTEALGSAVENP